MQIASFRGSLSARLGGLCALALAGAAHAQVMTKTLTYTRFSGPPDNVRRVDFTYDKTLGTTSFGPITTITSTPGADGVLYAPDGDIIVGGQADAVYKVNPINGTFATVTAGGYQSYHVMLDPSGTIVWTAAVPGGLASVPLDPFVNATPHALNGDDFIMTHMVFAGGKTYYTLSQPTGPGIFGTIDLDTFTTTRLQIGVPWAHGMTYDCFTGHVVAFANGYVAQIDPVTDAVVSLLDLSPLNLELDQGTSDGNGHLYLASNTGHMVFLDITLSGLVGRPDFVDVPFLELGLDDIAPDCGLGAPPNGIRSQGYWKTHPNAWPVTSLTIGCQTYTKAECLALLSTPAMGNASIILARQLIAAKVNVANNSLNWPTIVPDIEAADALLCTFPQRLPIAAKLMSRSDRSSMISLEEPLAAYNTSR